MLKAILILTFNLFLIAPKIGYTTFIKGLDIRSGLEINQLEKTSKGTILYFISATCPCSQAHFDYFNSLKKEFPDFDFYGVHSNKKVSNEEAKTYFQKFQIDFPIVDDRELIIANRFGAVKTPHIFILTAKEDILFQGGATDSQNPQRGKKLYLKDALVALSTGVEIKVKEAKTIGCYIER
jgi:hypothetical protein